MHLCLYICVLHALVALNVLNAYMSTQISSKAIMGTYANKDDGCLDLVYMTDVSRSGLLKFALGLEVCVCGRRVCVCVCVCVYVYVIFFRDTFCVHVDCFFFKFALGLEVCVCVAGVCVYVCMCMRFFFPGVGGRILRACVLFFFETFVSFCWVYRRVLLQIVHHNCKCCLTCTVHLADRG